MSFKVEDLIVDESVNQFALLAGSEQPTIPSIKTEQFTENEQDIILDTTYQLIELKSNAGLGQPLNARLPPVEGSLIQPIPNQYVTIFANGTDILTPITIRNLAAGPHVATANLSSYMVIQWVLEPNPRWLIISTNMEEE